jgi:hypothetical protein
MASALLNPSASLKLPQNHSLPETSQHAELW